MKPFFNLNVFCAGSESLLMSRLYQSLKPFSHWDPNNSMPNPPSNVPPANVIGDIFDDGINANPAGYGGVFNLEFSPDG